MDLDLLNAARQWWLENMPYLGRTPTDDEVLKAYASWHAGGQLCVVEWDDGTRTIEDADDLAKMDGQVTRG